jgi:hypothetical protein
MENLGNLKLYSADQPAVLNKPINQHKEYWQRKAERPEYDVLCEDIEQLGYVGTGRKYGVSDNAIRKWKRSYENEIKNPKVSHRFSHSNNQRKRPFNENH